MLPWWQTKFRKNSIYHSSLWKMLVVSQDSFSLWSCGCISVFLWETKLSAMFISQSMSNWYSCERTTHFSLSAPIRCLGKVRTEVEYNSQWDPQTSSSLSPLLSPMNSFWEDLFWIPSVLKQQWIANGIATSSVDLGPHYDSLWLEKIRKMFTKRKERKRGTDKYLF